MNALICVIRHDLLGEMGRVLSPALFKNRDFLREFLNKEEPNIKTKIIDIKMMKGSL
jgi:hypothetical protein